MYEPRSEANIGSDDGLSPVQHQAIMWTNATLFLIAPLGTKSMKFE